MIRQLAQRRSQDEGFTLIELLIAIVVVGILAAVVIIGVGSLADNGKKGACQSSRDAAIAASAVHYSNTNGTYPSTWADLTTAVAPKVPELDLSQGVTIAGQTISHGTDWSITMSGGGATPTAFSAC